MKRFFLFLILCISSIFVGNFNAEKLDVLDADVYEQTQARAVTSLQDNESKEFRGIYTSLSITLNGGDGKVWVTVRNDLTILPSTVYVIVQLYSSYDYAEDVNEMTLVCSNSSLDLNMGQSIIAEAYTNGEQRYWMGRMRYKIDNKEWEEKTVGPGVYNGNGDFVGIL